MSTTPRVIGGRYEIHEMIGRGGMAAVYAGIDRHTQRPVAIKQLERDVIEASSNALERFARESQVLRKLNHPNIVAIYAAVQDGEDSYVVMELVTGGDLANYLKDVKRMAIPALLEMALDLSDALTRAHRYNVIHRDIKPANVLLADDGTPRLTDFGVAHLGDSTRITRTGVVVGTLAYLSPEACMGDRLDSRTDIWSLGVMLYEMLTGYRPFMGESSAALLTAILSAPVPPIEKLRPDAPPALAQLIYRMLEKDREDRIRSVRQISVQLEAIINGETEYLLPEDSGHSEPVYVAPEDAALPRTPTGPTPISALQEAVRGYSQGTTPKVEMNTVIDPPPRATGEYAIGPDNDQRSSTRFMLLGLGIAAIALFLVAVALLGSGPQPLSVEPVAEHEYMVLVAQMDPLDADALDPTRLIIEDLTRAYEETFRFSPVRIRAYPEVITSPEQAMAVAQANRADVVLWGNYDSGVAEINVQVGAPVISYPDLFKREDVAALGDVTVRITDPRSQTLAHSVTAVLNVLVSYEDDIFAMASNLAILDSLDSLAVVPADVVGTTAAAEWHRFLGAYAYDPQQARLHADEVVRLAAGNPISYLGRSLNHLMRQDPNAAQQDLNSAFSLSPESWGMPYSYRGMLQALARSDYAAALDDLNVGVERSPGSWYPLMFRGLAAYGLGDFEAARTDIERVRALHTTSSVPYPLLIGLVLRDGDIAEVQNLVRFVRANFPEATGSRLLGASMGLTSSSSTMVALQSAFEQLIVLQWSRVIAEADAGLQTSGVVTGDLHMLKGIAQCNLTDYVGAAASYDAMLALDPGYTIGYLLRAEVRLKTGDVAGAAADLAAVASSPIAAQLTPMVAAFQDGAVDCTNLFDADLTPYYNAE